MISKDYKWYVVYTKNQHEKKVYEYSLRMNITSFLPLMRKIRFWSDRKKELETPLFPNYLFTKLSNKEYLKVLEHPSVIGFVKSGKELSSVSDEQINWIRKITENKADCHIKKNLVKGEAVQVVRGPLRGLKGEIVQSGNKDYIVMYLNQIKQSIYIKISKDVLAISN